MSRVPTMRPIVAYHAKFLVSRDDQVQSAVVDRPDWDDDDSIIAELGRETGARTVGEALVRSGAVFEDAKATKQGVGKRVYGWWDLV